MAVVIHGILKESREHYRRVKQEAVARLLINPRGHLKRNVVDGNTYISLRRTRAGIRTDCYIGPVLSDRAQHYAHWVAQSKKDIAILRDAKMAMRSLAMSKEEVHSQDYLPLIATIAESFDRAGLWEEGLELIGSWCFKVFQGNCNVEYYPERTVDVDFAVALPYKGPKKDIGELLQRLGFMPRFHQDGSVQYVSGELTVEFLTDRKGDGARRVKETVGAKDLGIAPVALPYLRILLENRMTLQARDIGKVVVPSLPAFMLHKLLVASKRSKQDKRLKDLRQAEAVAKAILDDQDLMAETRRIAAGMHKKWFQAICKEANNLPDLLPNSSGAVAVLLRDCGVGFMQ